MSAKPRKVQWHTAFDAGYFDLVAQGPIAHGALEIDLKFVVRNEFLLQAPTKSICLTRILAKQRAGFDISHPRVVKDGDIFRAFRDLTGPPLFNHKILLARYHVYNLADSLGQLFSKKAKRRAEEGGNSDTHPAEQEGQEDSEVILLTMGDNAKFV